MNSNSIREGCVVLFVVVAFVFLLLLLGGALFTTLEYFECQDMKRIHESHKFNFSWASGCRVKLDNGYWADVDDVEYIFGEMRIEQE